MQSTPEISSTFSVLLPDSIRTRLPASSIHSVPKNSSRYALKPAFTQKDGASMPAFRVVSSNITSLNRITYLDISPCLEKPAFFACETVKSS